MKHRSLLVVVAALFWLAAPLCAVACAGDGAAASAAPPAKPACHGAATGAPAPAEPAEPAGDHACDCETLKAVVAKAEGAGAGASFPQAASSTLLVPHFRVVPGARSVASFPGPRSLPPPARFLRNPPLLL